MPSEINVIGQTVDDASREVEKFVDRAFLAGLPRVRVVHGSGMGILRKALRQLSAEASARGVGGRASAKRRRRRSDGGGVEGVRRGGPSIPRPIASSSLLICCIMVTFAKHVQQRACDRSNSRSLPRSRINDFMTILRNGPQRCFHCRAIEDWLDRLMPARQCTK